MKCKLEFKHVRKDLVEVGLGCALFGDIFKGKFYPGVNSLEYGLTKEDLKGILVEINKYGGTQGARAR